MSESPVPSHPIQGSSEITILKALALDEGLMPFAGSNAYICRREAGTSSKNELSIPLKQIMKRKAPDTPLLADDILYISDAQGRGPSLAAFKKILLFGSGDVTALVYSGVR
jgi:polysaccharide biosynthesis/export protein